MNERKKTLNGGKREEEIRGKIRKERTIEVQEIFF